MMGKTFEKNIHHIFIGVLLLLASACVPKATEKKANCGADQAFNSVTRECISTQKARNLPVATTQSLTFTEKQIQDFTLSYSDKDSDLAVSCSVVDGDAKIELFSPKMSEAFTEAKKLVGYFETANIIHNAQIPLASHIASINSDLVDMKNDIATIEVEFAVGNVIPAYEDILAKAQTSYNLMKGYTSSSSLVYYNNLIRDQLVIAKPLLQSVSNRCFCDGAGVCKTRGGVMEKVQGPASFNYTVTDAIDGTSLSKQVTVNITNINEAPMAAPLFYKNVAPYFAESSSDTPVASGAVALPQAYDPDGNPLTFVKVSNPSYGSVSCTSSSCNYTPSSGNTNTTVAKVYGYIDFYGVRVLANHYGSWFNEIVITIKKSSNLEERFFNNGPYLKVNYPNIDIYMPENYTYLPQTIIDQFNNHPYLSLIATASNIAGGASQTVGSLPEAFTANDDGVLGSGGFDSFEFKYRDNKGLESNTAKFIFDLVPTNDPPKPEFISTAPVQTIVRNTTDITNSTYSVINLFTGATNFYSDPDATNNLATQCQVSMAAFTPGNPFTIESGATGAYIAKLGSCTCTLGQCSFEITSKYRNAPGIATVYYAFYDGIAWSQASAVKSMQVSVTPNNIAPSFGSDAIGAVSINEDADWQEIIRRPVWANDGYTAGDSEVITGSTRQEVKYAMSLSGATNLYNATDLTQSFRTKILTCTTADCSASCTESSVAVSTGAANFINLGFGSNATETKCLKIEYRPASMPEQSGNFDVSLQLVDVPKTSGEGSLNSASLSKNIVVNNVNDKPYVVGYASATSEIVLENLETAENSQALSVAYTVDEGGDSAEDNDVVSLIKDPAQTDFSDNQTLLPDSNIQIIFDRDGDGLYEKSAGGFSTDDGNEVFLASEGATIDLEDYDDPATLNDNSQGEPGMLVGKRLLFKVTPSAGNYGVANIRFKLKDKSVDPLFSPEESEKVYVISVVVHPVSTIHGGWTHLEAQGIKLTKRNTSLTQSYACASGARISGSGSPNGVQTSSATDSMDIYYDSTYKNCYVSTGLNTKNNWFSLNTYCPMSKKCKTGNNKACLFNTGDPALATIASTLGENEVYGVYNAGNVDCYRIDNQVGESYTPSNVTLAWKNFQIMTSSPSISTAISGYRIFRKKLNEEYDLAKPIMTVGANELSFTDTTPFGGRAYKYKVVPTVTINSKLINVFPPENFSEVKMLAPPANYSFVHRWMANQEVCNKMGFTVSQAAPNRVDPTNNYRCPYRGPGATIVGSNSYYDIGNDYLVDSFENGCPFTEEPRCVVNGANAACVGMDAPSYNSSLQNGDIYYQRSTGQCFVFNDVTNLWVDSNLVPSNGDLSSIKAQLSKSAITNFNPPLTNITRSNANAFCSMRSPIPVKTEGATTVNTSSFALPNRKEQIAFSAGPVEKQASNKSYNEYADSAIQTIEEGDSLNANAYCNSKYASGLESNFVDADYPPSSLIYTLPGNSSSSIRSLVTGSVPIGSNFKGTTMCVSRYGLQDIYGNVAEWVSDAFSWYNDPALGTGTNPTDGSTITYDYIRSTESYMLFDILGTASNTADDINYAFDYQIGPCNDSNTSNRCSAQDYISTPDWDVAERFYGATKLAFPVGLPFTETFATVYPLSNISDYLLDIGRASGGISSGALHGDKFTINDNRPNQNTVFPSGDVAMAIGGNYTSGNASGRYSFELLPAEHSDSKTGFRCRAIVNY